MLDPRCEAFYVILYKWVNGTESVLASSIYLPCDLVVRGGNELLDMVLLTAGGTRQEDFYRLHWQPLRD